MISFRFSIIMPEAIFSNCFDQQPKKLQVWKDLFGKSGQVAPENCRSPPSLLFWGRSARTFFSPDRGDCRLRKTKQNESLLAKIGFGTAENEPELLV